MKTDEYQENSKTWFKQMAAESYYDAGLTWGKMEKIAWALPKESTVSGSACPEYWAAMTKAWVGMDVLATYK